MPSFLEGEFEYPIDQTAVIERIGTIEIDAPAQRETQTISEVLGSVGDEKYDSHGELFDTVIGNVSDDYIGRKFYDDRGSNPAEIVSEPADEVDISF